MEKYPKLFILAAISYLLLGVLMGLGFTADVIDQLAGRFVHIHVGLLGFMAMFIYGVAYHILPRFNAKTFRFPVLVPVHFYLVNAGLLGMVIFGYMDGMYSSGPAHTGFLLSAVMEVTGIFIFAYNIIPVLLPITERQTAQTETKPEITADMKVSAVLDKWPGLLDLFSESGFKALTDPAARATFAKDVTIAQACKLHKVDPQRFLLKLNEAAENGAQTAPRPAQETPQKKAQTAMAKGKQISRGETAETETLIGSLIDVYPETKTVFEKHYGAGCFSCPGQAFETVGQTAMMHGIKGEIILGEVNEKIREALDDASVS